MGEKKKNESEATDVKTEEEPVKEEPEEELLELVPGLGWAVLKQGQEAETPSENLRPPTRPPRRPPHRPELEASLLETLLIVLLIHLLFEYVELGSGRR